MTTTATLLHESRSPAYWDNAYRKGARSMPVSPTERQLLRAWSQVTPGQFAVDVGCGRGSLAATMANWGLNVLGLDFSTVAIDAAQHMFQEHEHLSFDVFNANSDSEHHILQPGAVDLITCRFVLPFLDRSRFLVDARRWLRPGSGTLHITTAVHELPPPEHAHRGLTLAEISDLHDGWMHVTSYPIVDSGAIQGLVLRGPLR